MRSSLYFPLAIDELFAFGLDWIGDHRQPAPCSRSSSNKPGEVIQCLHLTLKVSAARDASGFDTNKTAGASDLHGSEVAAVDMGEPPETRHFIGCCGRWYDRLSALPAAWSPTRIHFYDIRMLLQRTG